MEALAETIRARSGIAHPFGIDAREEDEMAALFEQVEREIGPIEVALFNVGGNVRFEVTETTSRVYRKVWEMAAFAGAKHALRALAQSLARELGPKGIHVAHVVIDGAIDTQWIEERFPERYALRDRDGILKPDEIAENYWMLHQQPRSAWTHELDLRPWLEPW